MSPARTYARHRDAGSNRIVRFSTTDQKALAKGSQEFSYGEDAAYLQTVAPSRVTSCGSVPFAEAARSFRTASLACSTTTGHWLREVAPMCLL